MNPALKAEVFSQTACLIARHPTPKKKAHSTPSKATTSTMPGQPIPSSNEKANNGSAATVSLSASNLRGALILTMFTVVVIQLHLALNKFYAQSAPCPSILDGFKAAKLPTATSIAEKRRAEEKQKQLENSNDNLPIGLNAPNSKELPEINENGMIIFYLHIPKTGKGNIEEQYKRMNPR